MKKITAILLITCLVFCAAGYHVVFRFQVWQAKSDMQCLLLHSPLHKDLTELSFNEEDQKELEWEDDYEFRFKGEMFDVIEQYSKDGKLVIRCIADKKETALIEQYIRLNKNSNAGNKPLSSLVQLISAQFIQPPVLVLQPCIKIIKNSFGCYFTRLASIIHAIHTPPPEIC